MSKDNDNSRLHRLIAFLSDDLRPIDFELLKFEIENHLDNYGKR